MTAANTFQIGHTYHCRSICDYDCIYSFEVLKRTEKTVWLRYLNKVTARRVRIGDDGVEQCEPHGRYSMSPILRAAPWR